MDAANWLAHYADHRLDPLWRFHALHHSQEELSVLTSFRAHPLMHTTGFILATIPVVALMPGRPIAPVLITIYVCIGTLQHANIRWTFGPLGRVIVSPAYHRLHHAPDTQDTNLGVVLDDLGRPGRPARGSRPAPVPWGVPAWTGGRSPSSRTARPGRPCCCSPGSSSSRSRRKADAERAAARLSPGGPEAALVKYESARKTGPAAGTRQRGSGMRLSDRRWGRAMSPGSRSLRSRGCPRSPWTR